MRSVERLEDRVVVSEDGRRHDRKDRADHGGDLADDNQAVVAGLRPVAPDDVVGEERGGGVSAAEQVCMAAASMAAVTRPFSPTGSMRMTMNM